MPLKVAIIGAGPAGCMLARLLCCEGIQPAIFEGEATLNVRSQGGTLDLHTDTGLAALKKARLYDEFLKYARFDGESFISADKNMVKLLDMGGVTENTSRGRPEIDRPKLRQLLMDSLPPKIIRWNCRLRHVDDDLTLHFDHGTEKGFDLVVGADGAWSKLRPLLTSDKPFFSGVAGFNLSIPDAEFNAPQLYKLVRRGSLFSFSDGKAIMAQQMGDGSISVGPWYATDNDKDPCGNLLPKEWMCKQFKDWAPELTSLVEKADDSTTVFRPLYMLPVGTRWDHRCGVTLIGDAAHLMTPFAGEGVNVAFKDTMGLADAIVAAKDQSRNGANDGDASEHLHRYVKEFEIDMFARAQKVQDQTNTMMTLMFFSHGAPWTVIEQYILAAAADGVPRILFPLLFTAVYIYFFFFKLYHRPQKWYQ